MDYAKETPARFTPVPTPGTRPFWEGTQNGELRIQLCAHCGAHVLYPRPHCPQCGTHLFSEAESRPHLIFVRAGALDDPEIARPGSTIWTKSAPSWAAIDPALPKVEGQPPPVA